MPATVKRVSLMLRIRKGKPGHACDVRSFKMTQLGQFRWVIVDENSKFVAECASSGGFEITKAFQAIGLEVDEILHKKETEEVDVDPETFDEPPSPCPMSSVAQ